MKPNTKNTNMQTRKRSTGHETACKPSVTELSRVYSDDDYNSNDGMLTSVWGPGMWHYLHTMSFNYPVNPTKQDKMHYYSFMWSLRYVLPCGKCRANLRENYKKLPLTMKHMKNRASFSRYVFDLHELINTMLHKTSGLTYEIVRERYEHFRSRCTISTKKSGNKTQKRVHFAKKATVVKEAGCTDPLYGEKSKCILQIVPQTTKCETLSIDKECVKQKGSVVAALKTNEQNK
jgi:hypothetical protein